MDIASDIAMLSITAPILGRMETVHPVLLRDGPDVILVDTGYPGQLKQLRDQVESLGENWGRLRRILLTHQDIDHIGNLQRIAEEASQPIEIAAHELERPYIQGDRRLLRFTDEAIAGIDSLPEQVPASFKQGLKALMLHPPRARVDRAVADGERLPWCGGIVVVETPGHTPGHVSFYHETSRTLIAGDALVAKDGRLLGADPGTTLDRPTAAASIAKLVPLEIETAVCYHGGLCRGSPERIRARLVELASGAE